MFGLLLVKNGWYLISPGARSQWDRLFMGRRHLPYRPLPHTATDLRPADLNLPPKSDASSSYIKKKKKRREKHGISRPQFLVSLHITDNLGMLQNISSLKYFHGSNGELKQMGFQRDLSTHQTLLTQIIVQQSCSWVHITFWEKQRGYSEKGPAPRCYSSRRCLCAKVGAQCLERASAICCKCWERNSRMGEIILWYFAGKSKMVSKNKEKERGAPGENPLLPHSGFQKQELQLSGGRQEGWL